MPVCYFLPGILGSDLREERPNGRKIWLNYAEIASGGLERLRLDTFGLGPANVAQGRIVAGPNVLSTYFPALNAFIPDPRMKGYEIVVWPYDWRLNLLPTGLKLASVIAGDGVSRDSPCTIVGHSMGGLVARLAWYYLVRFGLSSYCRRIVTIGTPHYGSWSAAQLLMGIERSQRQIAQLERRVSVRWWEPLPESVPGTWIQGYLAGLFATFPSVYQLLPALSGPEYEQDPDRELYYEPSAYADLGWVSTFHLNYAHYEWQNLLTDQATHPPPVVLRCVNGFGQLTAGKTRHTAAGGVIRGSWTPGMGDTVVTEESAVLETYPAYECGISHQELPTVLAQNGELVSLILDTTIPPVPPPPTEWPFPTGFTDPGILTLLTRMVGHDALDC